MMSLEQAVDLVLLRRMVDLRIYLYKAPAATIGQLAEVMLDLLMLRMRLKS